MGYTVFLGSYTQSYLFFTLEAAGSTGIFKWNLILMVRDLPLKLKTFGCPWDYQGEK